MKAYVCLLVFVVGTMSVATVAEAQVARISRGAHVELAYIDGTEFVGRATDDEFANGLGVGDYRAEVVTDSSSCYATQTSTATVVGDSIVITGVLAIGSAQSVAGVHCFFHAWASVSIALNVESSGAIRLGGVLSDNAHVSCDLFNTGTGEHTSVQIPGVPGEFEYAAIIPQAGTYELSVFLDDIYSSQELGGRSVFAEFNLIAAAPGVVPTESLSWSGVKALWK